MPDIVRIPLRARDGSIRAYAVVDAADAAWANQWRWHLSGGYARRRVTTTPGRQRSVYLHRELLGLPRVWDGRDGDHIDRDKLNCRRSNLRELPEGKNSQNRRSYRNSTSAYRGVSWDRANRRWVARVQPIHTTGYLGYFATEIEAAEAVQSARLALLPFAVD